MIATAARTIARTERITFTGDDAAVGPAPGTAAGPGVTFGAWVGLCEGRVEVEAQKRDDAKQAMISSVTQNAPTVGSFVIPSMNGASLAHLPSSMSHA